MNKSIYFDNNATTQTDPRVVEVMLPYFTSYYGNPSSNHIQGKEAKKAVEESREFISHTINAKPKEFIFTSGATESINLILKGIAETYLDKGRHIITTKTEHSAVLDVCKYLEKKGLEIDYLTVDKEGLIDINEFGNKIRKDTILVSIIYANNETGVMQPIKKIGEICKVKDVLFFTDATQVVGKIPIDIKNLNIDLMCFSGHKFYGPKGVGGLYCRDKVQLEPLFHGGGQEKSLRSGTLNVPGIIGLAKALELTTNEMNQNRENIKYLRDTFENDLLKDEIATLNGDPKERLYNVSNICLTNLDPFLVQKELRSVAYSQGSACSSSSIKPSHVLKAMGLSDQQSFKSFRFSFGKYNTLDEINQVTQSLKKLFKQSQN